MPTRIRRSFCANCALAESLGLQAADTEFGIVFAARTLLYRSLRLCIRPRNTDSEVEAALDGLLEVSLATEAEAYSNGSSDCGAR